MLLKLQYVNNTNPLSNFKNDENFCLTVNKTRPVLDRFFDSGMEMLGVQLRKHLNLKNYDEKVCLKLRKCA
jgi:hypothetical protein